MLFRSVAAAATTKVRDARARKGPISPDFIIEDHLAAIGARLKPLKVLGVDLFGAAI